MMKQKGFTIVELLIVIIVIAVLAAITIVTYNGIQTRANNTAIIDAGAKTVNLIRAYVVVHGIYPVYWTGSGTSWACLSTDVTCTYNNGSVVSANSTFNTNIAKVGNVPQSVPVTGSSGNGVQMYWDPNFVLDGVSRPFMVTYWLVGINQQCKVNGVVTQSGSVLTTSTTGYTVGNEAGGKTRCSISIEGPVAS